MNRHISTSHGLVILALVLFAVGIAVWAAIDRTPSVEKQIQEREQATQEHLTEQKVTDTDAWTTYTNPDLGFSIQYPAARYEKDFELNDQYNRVVSFKSTTGKWAIEIRIDKNEKESGLGNDYGYLGSTIIGSYTLGGALGYRAVSPNGYFDAGASTGPFVAFGAPHDSDYYHIVIYGDAVVSEEELKIISTFKFIN